MCDLYEIILIIIIISLDQILLSYIANTSRTRTHTAVAVQVVAVRWRPTVTELRPFKLVSLAINGRSMLHSYKHWHGRPDFSDVLGVFRIQKIARLN